MGITCRGRGAHSSVQLLSHYLLELVFSSSFFVLPVFVLSVEFSLVILDMFVRDFCIC